MGYTLDSRDWDSNGIKIIRNAQTFTIEIQVEVDGLEPYAYVDCEIPVAEFCKALGLQPIPEGVRNDGMGRSAAGH